MEGVRRHTPRTSRLLRALCLAFASGLLPGCLPAGQGPLGPPPDEFVPVDATSGPADSGPADAGGRDLGPPILDVGGPLSCGTLSPCTNRCVDLTSDRTNCGSCGRRCFGAQQCVQSDCR